METKGGLIDDRMIDRYIIGQIRKRGITMYDILGDSYIDPDPDNGDVAAHSRMRPNRFTMSYSGYRLCELLTEGEFSEFDPYSKLAIPIKDLVRYWWDNIACQDCLLEEIFDDILIHFKDKINPKQPEEAIDISNALDYLNEEQDYYLSRQNLRKR